MEILIKIFGEGKELNTFQMSCRGVVIFLIALLLIRISGRRSFGVRTPFDNIIIILLGAILSRAVVGASDFIPTIITCPGYCRITPALRIFGNKERIFWQAGGRTKILLYKDGQFIKENMNRGLVGKEDILQGVRKSALTDSIEDIDKVYIERNGEISAIRKKQND